MKDHPKFLIATDLTEAAAKAVKCAAMIARKLNGELVLFHVFETADATVNKMMTASFLNREIKRQLQETADDVINNDGVSTCYLTRDGDLFEQIANAVKETDADVMFVGTHGIKGVQHITGSFIGKAVNSANIPFWVVQKESDISATEHIFIYVDPLSQKPLHSLILQLAIKFNSRLHFVFANAPTGFGLMQLTNELKAKLEGHTISYNIHNLNNETEDYKTFIELASKEKAPLLVINRCGKPVERFHEEIITNKHYLSVLCLNNDE